MLLMSGSSAVNSNKKVSSIIIHIGTLRRNMYKSSSGAIKSYRKGGTNDQPNRRLSREQIVNWNIL